MNMSEVRTRFAPSPTGYLHIGGLRTALYGWLFAKNHGGKFVLRVEDTDQQRYVEGATDLIYRTMKQTGLTYDEGPDVGGPYGPYIQSQRREIYQKYADELVERGGAYYCFCTKEEIEQRRKAAGHEEGAYKYDRKCADIPLDQARRRIANGEPYVVRQRIPDSGTASFDDLVYGHIEVDVHELEDGILLKSDGLPTYNFANVVDDSLMHITHIIRGTEYLSSTPKYNLIYQAFGWDIPQYLHLPPVMKDAHRKLSKRYGDASYEDFIRRGFLKEAILNYIALLGWNPGTNQELFTMEELAEAFDVKGISKSPAIFDENKLRWMNAEYIRHMDEAAFTAHAAPYYDQVLPTNDSQKQVLCQILQQRLETFAEIPDKIAFLRALPDYDLAMYCHKKMKTDLEKSKIALEKAQQVLGTLQDWQQQAIHDALLGAAAELGLKNGQMLWPVRVAVTGTQVTPGGAVEAAVLLGKEETLRRIQIGLERIGQNA